MPEISIVVPAKNEAENLPGLVAGVVAACEDAALDFEVIVVDDGSTDDSAARLVDLAKAEPRLRVVGHDVSGGQSAAVHSGVTHAKGRIVATLDGDGQNPPEELPRLIAPLIASDAPERLGLVAGQRAKRQDSLSKRLASRFANGLRSRVLRDGTRDTGCGLKAFRRDAFLALPFFNHMHRYLPALFARAGWTVAHVDVSHAQRQAGKSNYSNLQRGLVGAVDLFGVYWLIRRRKISKATELGGSE